MARATQAPNKFRSATLVRAGEAANPSRLPPLIPASSRDDFASAPTGRFVRRGSWCCICPAADLWVAALWGRPRVEDVEEFLDALEVQFLAGTPYASLFDIRQLEAVEDPVFKVIAGYLIKHSPEVARLNTKHAVVRPDGLVGAVAAGFYNVHSSPAARPVSIFTAMQPALAWLVHDLESSRVREIEELCRALPGDSQGLLARLRALLREDPAGASLERASVQMGVSARTLQRNLATLGTTFRRELDAIRIREAQSQLALGDRSVTEIALDVGFASSQSFWRHFRQATGMSPSSWKQRPTRPADRTGEPG